LRDNKTLRLSNFEVRHPRCVGVVYRPGSSRELIVDVVLRWGRSSFTS